MINDVTMVWKGVVDRMFRNGTSKCVQGSTGDKSSVSGGGQRREGTMPPPRSAGQEEVNAAWETKATGALAWVVFVLWGIAYL